MTTRHSEGKIVPFQTRHQIEQQHMEMMEREAQEARLKLFRGEISAEQYYEAVHRKQREQCLHCGKFH